MTTGGPASRDYFKGDPLMRSLHRRTPFPVALLFLGLFLAEGRTRADLILYGGIGRGSPDNAGFLITVDQTTAAGTLVGHPAGVPGLTGLAFGLDGTLFGSTVSGTFGTGRASSLV